MLQDSQRKRIVWVSGLAYKLGVGVEENLEWEGGRNTWYSAGVFPVSEVTGQAMAGAVILTREAFSKRRKICGSVDR